MGGHLPSDPGVVNELLQEAAHIQGPPPNEVVVTIPADHPQARALRELAEKLASEVRLDSGIVVKRLMLPGADIEMLNALRGVAPVDQMMDAAGLAEPPPPASSSMIAGLGLARAVGSMFGNGAAVSDLVESLMTEDNDA